MPSPRPASRRRRPAPAPRPARLASSASLSRLLALPRLLALALCGALLLLAACDDPSGVGVGVGGGLEGGEPRIIELPLIDLEPVTLGDSTTGVTRTVQVGQQPQQVRFGPTRLFAGRVDDPLTGRIEARGFLDLEQPFALPETFTGNPIARAVLELVPTYVYGDTTQAVELAVRETITEIVTGADARASDAPPNEQPVSQPLTTVTFLPTDSVVTVELPAVWLQRNEAVVRNDQLNLFAETFHGFTFEPQQGDAVMGFDATQSGVTFFGEQDTVRYGGNKIFSAITRNARRGTVPSERLLLQDGVGRVLDFSFDLDAAAIDSGASVVRAEFVFFADTSAVRVTGDPAFVRTQARTLQALGDTVLTEGAESDFLPLPFGAGDGIVGLEPSASFRFLSAPLRFLLQDAIAGGTLPYDRYRVRIPVAAQSGVSPLVLFSPEATQAARRPRLLITVVDTGD